MAQKEPEYSVLLVVNVYFINIRKNGVKILIIVITLIINFLIYRNYFSSIDRTKNNPYFYIIVSTIISVGTIELYMKIYGYFHINAMLWSIYIPYSMNLSYLFYKTLFFSKSSIISIMILWLKSLLCISLFIFIFHTYSNKYIITSQGNITYNLNLSIITFIIVIGSLLWLYGNNIFNPIKIFAKQIYVLLLIITPILMFFILEVSCNPNIRDMNIFSIFLNTLFMIFIELIILNIFKNKIYGLYLIYFGMFFIGVVNHFVIKFRNTPIMPTDIFALNTALSVSSGYQYEFTEGLSISLITTFLLISLLSVFNHLNIVNNFINKKRLIIQRFFSVSVFILSSLWIITSDFEKKFDITLDWWRPETTYYSNGFTTSFIAFLQKLKVEKPQTYSSQLSGEILGNTVKERKAVINSAMQKPNIIVIMNETFSDLSVLGPFESTKDHLKNFYSLKNDPGIIEHGYNYVSIRGGGTPNSEFEFLTGNSMSNLPGYYPYVMFDFKNMPSIVQSVKGQGYKAIAMHPENPNNWKRNVVYPALGFDEFLSYTSFQKDDTLLINRISDLSNYKKLIEVYESQEQPVFIFSVTMQNHGGYDFNIIKEEMRVSVDKQYIQYSDVQEYQSLINYSDEALEYLINYFRSVDDPVIICFFGDHQPVLNNEFENKLAKSGEMYGDSDLLTTEKYFSVPYFIWSNYDTGKSLVINNYEGTNVTSTNYLGVQVQYYAGLNLSKYGNFLLDLKEEIPVLNRLGYLGADDKWYSFTDNSDFSEYLKKYQIVQYNGMFDKKKNEKLFK